MHVLRDMDGFGTKNVFGLNLLIAIIAFVGSVTNMSKGTMGTASQCVYLLRAFTGSNNFLKAIIAHCDKEGEMVFRIILYIEARTKDPTRYRVAIDQGTVENNRALIHKAEKPCSAKYPGRGSSFRRGSNELDQER